MDKEDWQEDYDPDEGSTAICPSCGSDQCYPEPDAQLRRTRWECQACDHKGEWT